jgi:RNA polymerase sigma-B factor
MSAPAPARRGVPDRDHVRRLFRQLREGPDDAVRQELIEAHLGLVEYLARRFAGRGEPLEDLVQVGTIGLVKAVDRFDPDREVEFSTYATPTIVGELKRHFRDKGWAVRVPRRVQELHLRLGKVVSSLSQDLGRSPTIGEIAERAGASEEEVLEAMEAGRAYRFASLDAPGAAGDDDNQSLASQLGKDDPLLTGIEHRVALSPLIAELPRREQVILHLRFFEGLTQSEIAGRLGISQMHVSRLLGVALQNLAEAMAR